MGGFISSPIDDSTKKEIEDVIKNVLAYFALQYSKYYALSIVYKAKEDALADPRPYKLEERPEPWKGERISGWLLRENQGFVKGWKKQFFVVRHDWKIEIYNDENRTKKWRTVSPCGYNVIDNVNNGILLRLRRLAEKMGLDVSALPKPKEYPPFTLELHHQRRQCYFLQASNEEDFRKWVRELEFAAWLAYGLTNEEYVHKRAFNLAVQKTREHLGRWYWWSWGGTEEEILSDLIVDEIQWQVMDKVYSKIQGPWAVRSKIYNLIQKGLDKAVLAAVTPAWKGMAAAVDELRPKIEPKLKEVGTEIGKVEAEITDKLKDGAMSIIGPIIKEHVHPHLEKPVAFMTGPLKEAFAEATRIFEEHTTAPINLADEAETKKEYSRLDYIPHSWAIYRATDKLDVYYEPLEDLRTVFKDIHPWSIIWKGRNHIRDRTDDAIYTFEKLLGEDKDQPKVRAAVIETFQHDQRIAVRRALLHLIKTIIMPVIDALVKPLSKPLLEPLESLVPDPLSDFIDVEELFDRVKDGIVDDSITKAIKE